MSLCLKPNPLPALPYSPYFSSTMLHKNRVRVKIPLSITLTTIPLRTEVFCRKKSTHPINSEPLFVVLSKKGFWVVGVELNGIIF